MLGDEIKRLRLKAKLTQEQLAGRAHVSREYLSILENNKKSPTVELLMRLCKAMNVRPSRLMQKIE